MLFGNVRHMGTVGPSGIKGSRYIGGEERRVAQSWGVSAASSQKALHSGVGLYRQEGGSDGF